jgi:hypothetical protein
MDELEIMKPVFLSSFLNNVNAWQIRMIALTCLVLFVGSGSQALVSAFAASQPQTISVATSIVQPYQVAPLPSSRCVLLIQRSVGGFISDDPHIHYSFRRYCVPENDAVKSSAK